MSIPLAHEDFFWCHHLQLLALSFQSAQSHCRQPAKKTGRRTRQSEQRKSQNTSLISWIEFFVFQDAVKYHPRLFEHEQNDSITWTKLISRQRVHNKNKQTTNIANVANEFKMCEFFLLSFSLTALFVALSL